MDNQLKDAEIARLKAELRAARIGAELQRERTRANVTEIAFIGFIGGVERLLQAMPVTLQIRHRDTISQLAALRATLESK